MVVFRIGWKPDGNGGWGVRSTGQSVEHNTDLYAALLRLSNVYADRGNADQRELWRSDALWAGDWVVNKMYDDAAGRFYLGTACDNGVCAADTFHYALDVQTWTYLVFSQSPDFGGLRDWTRQLRWAEEKLAFNKGTVSGFDFGYNANAADRTPDGVWVEGTAQMALAYLLAGETDHYRATLLALEQLAQRQPGALVVAADRDGLSTGIDLSDGNPWQLFSRGALGATAWMLFAEAGYNPFWSAAAIPASAGYFHTAGRDIVSDTGDLKTVFRGVNLPGLDYGVFQQDFSNGPTIASSQPYPGVLGTNWCTGPLRARGSRSTTAPCIRRCSQRRGDSWRSVTLTTRRFSATT